MDYRVFAPPPDLRGLVQLAWTLRGPAGEGRQRVLPDGSVELVWNLGDRFRRHRPGAGEPELQPAALFVGPTTRHLEIEATGAVDLVGVRLLPGAAAALVAAPLAELRDAAVDARDVEGLAVPASLADRLAALAEPAARAAAALAAVEAAARPQRVDARVAALVAAMARRPACASVTAWARRAGLAPRALERRFRRHVGTSPKRLARLLRFQRVLAAAEGMPRLGAMLGAGYFDQSHFLRDFREFTGTSPTVFFRREANALSAAFTRAE
jgi:methylphosphotriester-DNA--protein-cysteine methyltransferase